LAPEAGQGHGTVVVGYDGSEAAQHAVGWAAEYAATVQCLLRVVHAFVWPVFTKNLGPVKGVEGSGLRHSAETILAEGVQLGRQSYRPLSDIVPGTSAGLNTAVPLPGDRTAVDGDRTAVDGDGDGESAGESESAVADSAVAASADVDGVMEAGLPAPVLRSAARDARLLVIGSRGIGGVLGQLAGSVCLDLAGSSPCPIIVIRRPRSPGQPVVVGIDGTSRSSAALSGAVHLAARLGTDLKVIYIDQSRGEGHDEHGRHGPLQGEEVLDRALAEARLLAPELGVSATLVHGRAASKELLAAAGDADVLVIGTHNREGGPGNTVSAVLHKARCNVLITR
jgi:nucleotide-binding universal stress UspA family protein